MARNIIRVNLELDRIRCHDEGDGWGSAEPYLWTVFFKLDGQTVQISESLSLTGPPTTVDTPGSHGNLNNTDVDEDEDVTIPADIGEWEAYLKPIPAPASLSGLFEDVGGVVGVIAILMEEDNVSDDGAEAGHQALNSAVRDALQEIINTRTISNQDVSEEEIKGFTDTIQTRIKEAIVSEQNAFEDFWSWLNPDDTIGVKVFVFKHDDLDPAVTTDFSHRWKNEGDWELFGHITSTPLCPANALNGLFSSSDAGAGGGAPDREQRREPFGDMGPMREFRDGGFREMPGLARWFGLAERHAGRVVRLALKDAELARAARKMVEWGNLIATEPDAPLPREHVEHARRLLTSLCAHRNRRARMDAKRALSVLEMLRGKTHRQAMQLLAGVAPARHPNIAGNPAARITPRTKSADLTQDRESES